jgi:hypothetical protein
LDAQTILNCLCIVTPVIAVALGEIRYQRKHRQSQREQAERDAARARRALDMSTAITTRRTPL